MLSSLWLAARPGVSRFLASYPGMKYSHTVYKELLIKMKQCTD